MCKPLAKLIDGLLRLNVSQWIVRDAFVDIVCPAVRSSLSETVCTDIVDTYLPTVCV